MISFSCWKCDFSPLVEDYTELFNETIPCYFCPACLATFPIPYAAGGVE